MKGAKKIHIAGPLVGRVADEYIEETNMEDHRRIKITMNEEQARRAIMAHDKAREAYQASISDSRLNTAGALARFNDTRRPSAEAGLKLSGCGAVCLDGQMFYEAT